MAKTAVSRARASATASTLSSTVATWESASPTLSREYLVALVARLLTTSEATTVAPRSRSTSRSTSFVLTNGLRLVAGCRTPGACRSRTACEPAQPGVQQTEHADDPGSGPGRLHVADVDLPGPRPDQAREGAVDARR